MSEEENQVIEDSGSWEEERPPLISQIGAIFVLAVVCFGVWLLFRYLPVAGDWIGAQTGQFLQEEVGEGSPVALPALEPEPSVPHPAVDSPPAARGDRSSFEAQIVAQLGGAEKAELRHLALSEDGTRMVVALQITPDDGEKQLVEVFLERDEFGRYLSSEDSPAGVSLKLWSE